MHSKVHLLFLLMIQWYYEDLGTDFILVTENLACFETVNSICMQRESKFNHLHVAVE